MTFIITHGMGGTAADDRFHKLAALIAKLFPDACVIRVDWCELASAKIYGVPNVLQVAASIDEVGDQAALLLQQEKIDPHRAICIGESFGNWVNARIAAKLGGVQGILAMNPANEAAYPLPDLRRHAQRSWSFHTYSAFDTTCEIAENDFWLQTPARTNHLGQHTAGIQWLSARLEAGDASWLQMDKVQPSRREGCFQALVTMDGSLSDEQLPRERPAPEAAPSKPAAPPATDVVAANP
jgi:pimeloyl-ACP methyl ester carboxylesterase